MINSVAGFIATCSVLDSDAIYELFEDLNDAVRNSILRYAYPKSPEPVRSALNRLGKVYKVKSLEDY